MFEQLLNWFAEYGYWIVFLGSLIEGESVILTAGYLASLGKLNLYLIMLIAFIGTLIADQSTFYIGHKYGKNFIDKYAFLKKNSERVNRLLHEYDAWFIMLMRFVYGIRIAGPIIVGASGLSPKRFAYLNVPSAAVWSILSCSAGYVLGESIEWALANKDIVYKYFLIFLVSATVLIYSFIKGYRYIMSKFD